MNRKPDIYKGADISFLPQCLDAGMQVKDLDGLPKDPFELLQKHGVNAIRLRLWHTPENVPESGGYCDLSHTISMAEKIREYGMQFMLDFHYSDFWADPGQQRKPKAWENLGPGQLEEAVFRYTADTLRTMKKKGVLPDIVQIGNEIRSGLLFPDGELPDCAGMVRLVNAGIRGARSVAGPEEMQIMIHLDQGGRYFYLKEWFSNAFASGLMDFDLIGLSYYPFWHGTYADLKSTMERLAKEYGKPIMVVESAYAWRTCADGFIDEAQEKLAGFPASPQGQRKVLELINGIVASVPDKMGLGVFYWEPLCLPVNGVGAWGKNMGLLDETGQALEGIRAFEFEREDYDPLRWKERYEPLYAQAGKKTEDILPEGRNLLRNPGWEEGMDSWKTEGSDGCTSALSDPEEGQEQTIRTLCVEGTKNFTFRLSQQVPVTEPGSYCFQAEIQGTDTTGVHVSLFVQAETGGTELMVHPTEHEFTGFRTEAVKLEAGTVTVGISITASPMFAKVRRLSFFQSPVRK